MKFTNIESSELPDIDSAVKECVNMGQWMLFKSNAKSANTVENVLYLKVGQSVYTLNEKGGVMDEIKNTVDSLQMDEVFYFSDLPKPVSLSNAASVL